mmetsp:Transcript_32005/g.63797  ORF Transcript_32005/g.63797 Transcript_32005/m.63797 type:complete len:286 (-) Transcript_32005:777-1634(-)
MLWSEEPDANVMLSSGLQSTSSTCPRCPSCLCFTFPAATSHTTVEKSYDPVKRFAPSPLNCKLKMGWVCPASVLMCFPCLLNMRAAPSAPPVASTDPSGDHVSAVTLLSSHGCLRAAFTDPFAPPAVSLPDADGGEALSPPTAAAATPFPALLAACTAVAPAAASSAASGCLFPSKMRARFDTCVALWPSSPSSSMPSPSPATAALPAGGAVDAVNDAGDGGAASHDAAAFPEDAPGVSTSPLSVCGLVAFCCTGSWSNVSEDEDEGDSEEVPADHILAVESPFP